jgi:hypothetical protein
MRALGAVSVALLVVACGGSTPPPAEPGPAAAETASGAAPAEEPPAAEDEPAIPRAKLLELLPGKQSPDDRRAKIAFENPTRSPCTFTSYTLVWSGGRKTIEEKPFVIPPGGTRQRTLVLHPNDGDIAKLSVADTEIEVNAGCAGSGK